MSSNNGKSLEDVIRAYGVDIGGKRVEHIVNEICAITAIMLIEKLKREVGIVPEINEDGIKIVSLVTSIGVILNVRGELGDKMENPDVVFMFNEHFCKEDLVSDEKLSSLVVGYYKDARLMKYSMR